MDLKQLLGAIGAMLVKIVLAAAVIIIIFKLAVGAYDFGFNLFADIPVDEENGRTVNVIISDNQDAKDVGAMLEEKGLIRDANMFYILEMLSDANGDIVAGTYELNTSMSIEEMLDIICSNENAEDAE